MIGLFGGTFDPIHFGHLRCALEIAEQLQLGEVRMLPCGQPPHRDAPQATAAQRRRAVELALQGQSLLCLDSRELERPGPSYMVDTLTSLRAEVGNQSVCLILGQDAFNGLASWQQWERLPELAHLVVITRPGVESPTQGPIAALVAQRAVDNAEVLRTRAAGAILFCQVTALEISASDIRARLANGRSVKYLLPDAVLEYLVQEVVYQ